MNNYIPNLTSNLHLSQAIGSLPEQEAKKLADAAASPDGAEVTITTNKTMLNITSTLTPLGSRLHIIVNNMQPFEDGLSQLTHVSGLSDPDSTDSCSTGCAHGNDIYFCLFLEGSLKNRSSQTPRTIHLGFYPCSSNASPAYERTIQVPHNTYNIKMLPCSVLLQNAADALIVDVPRGAPYKSLLNSFLDDAVKMLQKVSSPKK